MKYAIRGVLTFFFLGPFVPSAHGQDGIVEAGFELLDDARRLDPEGAALHGMKFDRLMIDFYDRMVRLELAEKIDQTFLGDNVTHGYRIGNTEIWLQKQVAPGASN